MLVYYLHAIPQSNKNMSFEDSNIAMIPSLAEVHYQLPAKRN